jgi:hypothetical protein
MQIFSKCLQLRYRKNLRVNNALAVLVRVCRHRTATYILQMSRIAFRVPFRFALVHPPAISFHIPFFPAYFLDNCPTLSDIYANIYIYIYCSPWPSFCLRFSIFFRRPVRFMHIPLLLYHVESSADTRKAWEWCYPQMSRNKMKKIS